MAKVILINPHKDVPLLDWAMRYPPLGLMSIASSLTGHDVEIMDLKVDLISEEEIIKKFSKADIIGISVLTPSIDEAFYLCRLAKKFDCLTVLGGIHPSLVPEIVENQEVDIVVRGEGEVSFKEICDGIPLEDIAGISYKDKGKVVKNPDRTPANPRDLPFPRRDLVLKYRGKYMAWGKRLDAISTARGCPYNCNFCCVPRVWKSYRERKPTEIIKEIKQMDPDADIIAFVDDNFSSDMKRVEQICDLIIKEGLNNRLYSCFSRIDSIVNHPDIVDKMAEANIRVVFIGIEAASQESLDKMKKKTKLEDIYKACNILEEKGIMIWAGHIIGNLDDGYGDVDNLIRLSKKLPIDIAQYTVITPYPDTELYESAKNKNLIDNFDLTQYCECEPPMHTKHLSRMEILELEIKAYLEFYGFWAVLKRIRRWSKNPAKKWLLNKNMRTFREFGNFRRKCAFYFAKTYKELLGKTYDTKTDKTVLVIGPKLYSAISGIIAGLTTFLITTSIDKGLIEYTSLNPIFSFIDIVASSLIASFTTAFVATWVTTKVYLSGFILSLKKRKQALTKTTLLDKALNNTIHYGMIAFIIMIIFCLFFVTNNFLLSLPKETLWVKEISIALVAFFTSLFVSFKSIDDVRNKEII